MAGTPVGPSYINPAGGGGPATTVVSGAIGSGSFASGATAPYALGLIDSYTTAEVISGGRAGAFNGSGLLRIAMAAVSGRMPAVGVIPDNYLSGAIATIFRDGMLLSTALSTDAMAGGVSGYVNQLLYVGRSGNLVGNINSGQAQAPILSGDVQQALGIGVSWSGIYLGRL